MSEDQKWSRIRGPSEEKEQASAHQLRERIALTKRLIERFEQESGQTPPPSSALAGDDEATDPLQLSHLAGYALTVAVDNLNALFALLEDGADLRVFQVAQYPLIRSAIEAAALTTWLLGPADRRTRILHLLQARMDEVIYDKRLIRRVAVIQPDDSAEERRQRNAERRRGEAHDRKSRASLAAIANRSGITPEEYERGQPGWQQLTEDAAQYAYNARPDMSATTWMALSGLSHPSSARALMFSIVEELAPPVNGVHTARISGSAQSISMGLAAAFIFLNGAVRLNRERRIQTA